MDRVIDWTMPMDAEDRGRLAATRQRFTEAGCAIGRGDRTADAVAAVVKTYLSTVTTAELPPAAQQHWADRVARPLKADPAKPLPERSLRGVLSWPSARIGELAAALAEIEAILVETENEAHHEAIYAEISRTYS